MDNVKRVCDLSSADLAANRVWEAAGVHDKYEPYHYVRPYLNAQTEPLDTSGDRFLVRASFRLADGTEMTGFISPDGPARTELITLQPAIITDTGQVYFWCGGEEPSQQDLERSYSILKRPRENVFPIEFEADVDLRGGPFSGKIPGFLVLVHWKTGETRIVT